MRHERLEALLVPVSPGVPGGEDLSFHPLLDEIREARRADDPHLQQGAWVRDLKQAHWPKVKDLCFEALARRSKDLQIAGWYAEALTHLEGLGGLAEGFRLLQAMIVHHWEHLYPSLEEGLEVRMARLEWLEANLPSVVKGLPMTSPASGGHSWSAWNEALRNESRPAAGEPEGRLTLAAFEKSVTASGADFYARLAAEAMAAVESLTELARAVDERAGPEAPAFDELRSALEAVANLAGTLNRRFTGGVADGPARDHASPTVLLAGPDWEGGPVSNRSQAVTQLREVAAYFRRHEPHSPVAPLVERAARWAAMDLEAWLAEVVKDEGSLGQLRTLLDFNQA